MTTTPPAGVTATDLRGAIAKLLRDAEYGIKTTITRDGIPVARIVPITCGQCGAAVRPSVSGTAWVDGDGWDHCLDSDTSHEPEGATTPTTSRSST